MQEPASFWTDIKSLEEQFAKSPDSLCFARLSDVYLKAGLVDDAVHVARQGVTKHPRYLSGQRALSLACHAKGLNDEAMAALKSVTEALPEDVQSQKLLGRLLAESGDRGAARRTFMTALEFAPDDVECRLELESLERSAVAEETVFEADEDDEDDEEIIEDLEILEEFDLLEEEQPGSGFQSTTAAIELDSLPGAQHDPLSTGTLAELYVTQGFIHKALEIYRAILVDNPADRVVAERVAELEALETGPSGSESDFTFEEEAGGESNSDMTVEAFVPKTAPKVLPESAVISVLEGQQASGDFSGVVSGASVQPSPAVNDHVLSVLEGWLASIRRVKLCR
ncbi:MAG: tetratricopeptide repeat protein [Desulfuromonadaceae bacterium]|nr:tetratricopeptide repeat protein [Desulfuromonadaceae bacterium]